MSARLKRACWLAAAMSLAGCTTFGPQRDPPQMPQPDAYAAAPLDIAQPGGTERAGTLPGTQRAVPAAVVPEWWHVFGSDALDGLVAEGLAHSPTLATARSTLQAAREQLRGQIGNNAFPSIDAVFEPQRQRALGIPIAPQYETFIENIFVAQVQATYTFDFFGAAIMADRALARQVQQQVHQLDATRRALTVNIVAAVIHAAALQEQLEATASLVALGEDRAGQVEARYQLGSASHDELFAARQDAANAAASLPPLRAQLLAVRHALAVLLGRTPEQAPEPLRLDALRLPETLPLSVPSELLRQRPDILAAEAAVRATADETGAATAALFPSLTLSASYGHGGFDWTTFTSPAGVIWGFSAGLTQPLFRGGALRARRRQYQATYEAAVADYKRTVLSAFQAVADDLVSLDTDAESLTAARQVLDAARSTHGDSEARYRLGAAPYYATLTARQQVQSATAQYVRARAAQLADTAALLDALGEAPATAARH